MNRVDRLTAILLFLQARKRTAGEIARRFEVSRRTILRDIQALCEMDGGLMIIKAVSDGSSLCVLAGPDCDTEVVSYEMSRLVEAVSEVLSPALRGGGQTVI